MASRGVSSHKLTERAGFDPNQSLILAGNGFPMVGVRRRKAKVGYDGSLHRLSVNYSSKK